MQLSLEEERKELLQNRKKLQKEIAELSHKGNSVRGIKLNSELSFFKRVVDDLVGNFEEEIEIKKSLWEINELVDSLNEALNKFQDTQAPASAGNRALRTDLKNNMKVREKLERALDINLKQKNTLSKLLLNLYKNRNKNVHKLEISKKKSQIENIGKKEIY